MVMYCIEWLDYFNCAWVEVLSTFVPKSLIDIESWECFLKFGDMLNAGDKDVNNSND